MLDNQKGVLHNDLKSKRYRVRSNAPSFLEQKNRFENPLWIIKPVFSVL